MKTTKCPDCGTYVRETEATCPNCGCPIDHMAEELDEQTNQQPACNADVDGSISALLKTDFANYVYESFEIARDTFYKRSFLFSGRATRREFWSFFFLWQAMPLAFFPLFPICLLLYIFAIFPAIGVTARRLHDNEHSGWWMLVPFYCLFLCMQRNNPEPNEYGDPETL